MVNIKKLNCGVRLVTEKISHVQSAAIGIWVKNGAVDEYKEVSGISHFIEHMMFKGTENRTAKKIAEDIDKIGGQINAFTGKEATCYYVKVINTHLFDGAEVLLDMLNNSVFDSKEMTKERQVICEEIKMIEDQPDDLAHDTVCEMVFRGNELGNSIIGTKSSLKRITRPVMVDYKNKTYTKDSIVISASGNFDEEELAKYLEDKFDKIFDSKPARKETAVEYKPSYKVIVKDIQQSHICMATKTIALGDPRYYSFSVLNNIMGGSMSSRLFQNIREEKGLAYSVYSMNSTFSTSGYYNIYVGVSHDKVAAAIDGIKEELDVLAAKGVSDEELSMSKEQLKSSYIFGQENVASRMFAIGKNLLLLGKVFTAEEVLKGIEEVSHESINAIKPMICNIDNYSAVCVNRDKINLKKMIR
ncbi:MAG: insulinase family protein [Firmicutes bacterium]|nr:insulinase family protein [Bacillota bacterium]